MISAFSSMTKVIRFKSLFFILCFSLRTNFSPSPIKYSYTRCSFYMNMGRFVFLTIEEKRKTKESKYFWHILFTAKIGILFDTSKKYYYILGLFNRKDWFFPELFPVALDFFPIISFHRMESHGKVGIALFLLLSLQQKKRKATEETQRYRNRPHTAQDAYNYLLYCILQSAVRRHHRTKTARWPHNLNY